ncbi:hypothetical protein ACFWIB_37875 [Streptomyces sp. NPDC127051]|uniref:hypothetical protein n=1 Tax=Streptomyces sp. NPDC127051 TaxID=3347119 RepID=UPI0036666641
MVLSDTAGRVDEVSLRPVDIWTTACQELLAEVAKAKKHGGPPSEDAHGGSECVAGAAIKNEAGASAGIREVQQASADWRPRRP